MTQTLYVTGVVEDGSARDPALPRNTATTVLMPQFASVGLNVLVFSASGAPIDLSSAGSPPVGTFTMQRVLDSCQKLPEQQLTGAWAGAPGAKNLLLFSILPKHTRHLALGRYFFDVWLTLPAGPLTGKWQIVGTSVVVLQAALQRA